MSTKYSQQEDNDAGEVATALRGLKRVNAPPDFDIRLKARIIERNAVSKSTAGRWGFMRIAAPAALIAVIAFAGYFAVTRFVRTDIPEIAGVEPPVAMPLIEDSYLTQPSPVPAQGNLPQNGRTASTETPTMTDVAAANNGTRRSGPQTGGSEDRAATAPEAPILPPGFDPDSRGTEPPPGLDPRSEFSVSEILQLVGLRTAISNGRWTVLSVDQSGAAGRSGVRAGDVVIAIDKASVTGRTAIMGPAVVKNITVRRGGTVIEIPIIR